MKILAIRGKNLASLASEFDIPFQQEPLASAGLFAICGPTGAGKSTLLDALCLALYDDTPRLLKASSTGLPDVAGETVTAQDTRTLLRRGAAEGYAEVDFVGNDGREYRARWSVRRSRSKNDGKLQGISMSLHSLPDQQPIGGSTKGEVKAEIEQRIGLSFEQFTRSVLLAQNEFSAFLKADDNERGALLETLTGIVVFTTISKRAFEREKTEKAALARLNERLADHKPLSLEARTQLDLDSTQADESLSSLELRKQALDAHLRWHQALDKALQIELLAQQEFDNLSVAQQTAAPRREQFTRIEAVQGARSLLEDCARIEAEMSRNQLAITNSETELAQATQAMQAAKAAQQVLRQELHDAEQMQAAATPELDQAKALDTKLETLQPHHHKTLQSLGEVRSAESTARLALENNEQQRTLACDVLSNSDDWLRQHAHHNNLAEHWPRWDTLLLQAAQHATEHARFAAELSDAQNSEAQQVKADATAKQQLDMAAQAVALAESGRAIAQQKLDGFDAAKRLERKQAAEFRRELLVSAEQQWQKLAHSLTEQTRLNAEKEQSRETLEQADSALDLLHERMPVAEAELALAEKSLKQAEAACAENVESLRAALEAEQPCPVCGSAAHPYSSGDARLRTVLQGLQANVSNYRQRLHQLQQKHATNSTRAEDSRMQLAEIMPQLLALEQGVHELQATWDCNAIAGELGGIIGSDRANWFTAQQQNMRELLQVIATEEQAERAVAADKDKAQAECESATTRHATSKDALTVTQAELQNACAVHKACAQKLADCSRRLEATLDELDGAFVDRAWMENWRKAPQAFYAKYKSEVEQWKMQSKVREESQLQLDKLEVVHAVLAESLSKASVQLSSSEAAFATSSVEIETIQNARHELFGGKTVDEVHAELGAAITAAKHKLDQQIELTQQGINAQTRHQEARDQASQRHAEQTLGAAAATAALEEWVEQFNLSNPAAPVGNEQLRALLAHTAKWINAERQQLQAIAASLQQAETVLQERKTQRQAHEQSRPTEDDADALLDALSRLEAERQTAQTQATELRLKIAKDSERRTQSAAMLGEIEQQEASHRLWAQMGELIGSADGKKFRNYAQQFTLDVLLGYANKHLFELSRRYRLQRISESLALMVVDQDMGDELRSVYSLSGGESFLVSLALALALASLSSNRVRVESLFIDEGFGSLDPETLSVALDALDGLQAMGRKVGVISHVQEMTERISTRILVQRMSEGRSQVVIA